MSGREVRLRWRETPEESRRREMASRGTAEMWERDKQVMWHHVNTIY